MRTEDLEDLLDRLQRAALALDSHAAGQKRWSGGQTELARIKGKAEGVRLAISYVREIPNRVNS